MRITLALSGLLLLITMGCICPQPVGKCTYGKNKLKYEQARIIKIERGIFYGRDQYAVLVRGTYQRKFTFLPKRFQRCFTQNNLKVGSMVKGILKDGGPCPTQYYLDIPGCKTGL
jgi:hypothetical protein